MLNPAMMQQIMGNAQQFQQFQAQFQAFAQQFQGGQQMSPQAIIQQKLNSGEMTQAQFEQLRQSANQMYQMMGMSGPMGMNR